MIDGASGNGAPGKGRPGADPAGATAALGTLWPALRARVEVESARRQDGIPVLVAVDGRSGAGKTDLALALAEAVRGLGTSCVVVHLDDLYPGWDGLASALGPLCAQVVAPLRSGRPGSYASWDWDASAPGPRREVPVAAVVIVEGVGVLASSCAEDLDVRVWLEAPREVRRARALTRDGEIFAPHWQRWAAQEDALFADGVPAATDVVVDTVSGTARWDRMTP